MWGCRVAFEFVYNYAGKYVLPVYLLSSDVASVEEFEHFSKRNETLPPDVFDDTL